MKKFLLHFIIAILLGNNLPGADLFNSAEKYSIYGQENNSDATFYNNYLQSNLGVDKIYGPYEAEAEDPVFALLNSEATICFGDTYTFDATVSNIGIIKYAWDVWDASGAQVTTPTLTIGDAGTYTITVTDTEGNQTTATVKLNVITFDVILPGDQTICKESSYNIQIYGIPNNYQNHITYNWSNSLGSIPVNTDKLTVSETDTYTVEVVYDDGEVVCTEESSVYIEFPDPLVPDLGGDQTVCSGDTFTVNTGIADSEIIAVTWKKGNFVVGNDKTLNIADIKLSDEGTYTAVVTGLGGCDYEADINLTVINTPDFYIKDSKELCSAQSPLEIVLNNKTPGQTYLYKWFAPDGSEIAGETGTLYIAHDAGIYRAEVTAKTTSGECSSSREVEIFPAIDNYKIKDYPEEACEGEDLVLDATLILINSKGEEFEIPADYLWTITYDDGSTSTSTNPIQTLNTVEQSGTYSVSVTSISGCTYNDVADIQIIPNPVFNLEDDKILCIDENTLIEEATFGIENFSPQAGITYTYELRDENDVLIETSTPPYTVSNNGRYTLSITANGICTITDDILVYPAQTLFAPESIGICEGEGDITASVNFDAPNSGLPVTWTWTDPDGNVIGDAISTINDSKIVIDDTPSSTGTYTVTAETGGCTYTETIDIEIKETVDASAPSMSLCANTEVDVPVSVNNLLPGVTYTYILSYYGTELDTKIITNGDEPVFNVDQPGTYDVSISTENDIHCATNIEFNIGNPVIEIIPEGYPRCEDSTDPHSLTAQLTFIPDYYTPAVTQYIWKRDGVVVFGNSDSISPETPDESGSYTVTAILDDGCEVTSEPYEVRIYESPYFELGDLALCGEGAELLLQPLDEAGFPIVYPDDYKFTWTASKYKKYEGHIPVGHEHDRTITIDQPGGYSLTVETPDGECVYTSPATGILREILKFVPTAFVCSDHGQHFLNGVVEQGNVVHKEEDGKIGFYWTYDKLYDHENPDPNQVVVRSDKLQIDSPGTYYVVAHTMRDCWLEYEAEVDIMVDYFVEFNVTDNEICLDEGDTFTLTVDGQSNGTNDIPDGYFYTWMRLNTETGEFELLPEPNPTTTNEYTIDEPGVYKVAVTPDGRHDYACENNIATVVIGGRTGILELGGPYVICDDPNVTGDESIEIGVDLSILLGINKNKITYEWSKKIADGSYIGITTGKNPFFTVTIGGTYRVIATADDGCIYEDEVEVHIIQQSLIEIQDIDSHICDSEDVILTVNEINGSTSYNEDLIKWYYGIEAEENEFATGNNITVTGGGVYIAVYEDPAAAGECIKSTDQVEVTFHPTPILNEVDDIGPICASEEISVEVELQSTWIPTIFSDIIYTIYDPNGNVYSAEDLLNPFPFGNRDHTFNLGLLTVEQSGTWSVTAEYDGCISEAQYFDVEITPIPEIELGGDRMLCEETKTLIVKANVGEEDGALFEWFQNGIPMGITANQITVYESGTYGVSVELNDCWNYTEVDVVQASEDLDLLGGTAQICDGDNYVIDASLNLGILDSYYEWYKDDILMDGVNTPSVTISEAGFYKVLITDNLSGCTYEEEFELTVVNLDDIGIDDNIAITACDGEIGFSPDPIFEGATYLWTVNDEHGNYKDSQEGTFFTYKEWYEIDYQYIVQAYVGSCTSDLKNFTLVSGKTPDFTFSSYNESCSLSTLKIENNFVAGTTFTWFRGDDDITNEVAAQDPSLLSFDTDVSGEYTVVGKNGDCDLTIVIPVTVFGDQGIIEEEDITLCNGETSIHDITIPNALFYIVDGFERKPDENGKVIVELKNQGIHTFQIKTTDGCDLFDEVLVTLQTLKIDLGTDRIACVGEILTLVPTGDIAENYVWYFDGVLQTPNTRTIEYTVEGEATIQLIATKGGCEIIDEIGIHIHEDPEINLPNYEICRSELPITMDATVVIPGASYQWNDMNDTDPGYDNPVRTITTEEAVAGENVYQINIHTPQCTYTRDVIIDVYPDPSFSFGEDISGCLPRRPELKIDLQAGVEENVASYEWFWDLDGDGNFDPIVGASQNIYTVYQMGTYKAVVITNDGCEHEDLIHVDYILQPTFELGEEISECTISNPELEVVIDNPDMTQSTDIATYEWLYSDTEFGLFAPINGANSSVYTVDKKGYFSAVVTSIDGCIYMDTIFVNHHPLPIVGIDNENLDCNTEGAKLTAVIDNIALFNQLNEAVNYKWYINDVEQSAETSQDITVTENGEYKVVAFTEHCINKDSLDVIFTPQPVVSLSHDALECLEEYPVINSTVENQELLDQFGVSVSTYEWYRNTVKIDGETGPDLIVTQDGTYTLIASTPDCSTTVETEINVSFEPVFEMDDEFTQCSETSPTLEVIITNPGINQDTDIANYLWEFKENIGDTYAELINDAVTRSHVAVDIGYYRITVTTTEGCDYPQEVFVDSKPNPVVNIDDEIYDCSETPSTLTAVVENEDILVNTHGQTITYQWYLQKDGESGFNPVSTDQTIDVSYDGVYAVTASTETCSDSIAIPVNYIPMPEIALNTVQLGCSEERPFVEVEILNDSIIDNVTYEWYHQATVADPRTLVIGQTTSLLSTPDTDPALADGIYTVVVTTDENCSTEASTEINYTPAPAFTLDDNITICTPENVDIDLNITITNPDIDIANDIASYEWFYNEADSINFPATPIATGPTYTASVEGFFMAVVKTHDNCEAVEKMYIDYQPTPVIEISTDELHCTTEENVRVHVDVTNKADIDAEGETLTYIWYLKEIGQPNFVEYTYADEDGDPSTALITANGEYMVEVVTNGGCLATLTTDVLYYEPEPVVSIADVSAECLTETPTLSATVENNNVFVKHNINLSYEWYHRADATVPAPGTLIGSTLEIEANNDGIYTFIAKTDYDCNGEISKEIDFRFEPVFSLQDDIAGCYPEYPALEVIIENTDEVDQANDIASYEWSFKAEESGTYEVTDSILSHYYINKEGYYKVVVTTNDGCPATDEVYVDYHPEPIVDLVTNYDDEICSTTALSISAVIENEEALEGTSLTYKWNIPNKDGTRTDTITNTGELEVYTKGWYYLTVVTEFDCISNQAEIEVLHGPTPLVEVISQNYTGLCTSDPVLLEANITNMENVFNDLVFEWYFEDERLSETSDKLIVTDGGEYKLVVKTEDECTSDTSKFIVDYRPIPEISLTTSDNVDQCTKEDVVITVEINNGVDASYISEYQWNLPDGTQVTTIEPQLTATQKGNYSVVAITTEACESNLAVVPVNYLPIPVINLETNWTGSECVKDGGLIIANSQAIDYNGTITYHWTLPDLSTVDTTEPEIEVHSSGRYIVYAVTEDDCQSDPDTITVDYNPEPTFVLSDIETCETDTAILEVNITEPDLNPADLTYTWSNGVSGKGISSIEVTVDGDIETPTVQNYSVTVTNNLCNVTHDANVTFNPTPVFDLGEDLSMCEYSTRTLTVNSPLAGLNIVWNTGETGNTITVSETGEYIATAELNGCTYSDTVFVEKTPFPEFSIEVISLDCENKIITLGAVTDDADVSYEWGTGETTKTIQVNKGGDYTLSMKKNGCNVVKNFELKNQFFEDLNSSEEMILCKGDSLTLEPDYDFESILWSNGSTDPVLTVSEGGIYSATVVNAFYCDVNLEYDVTVDEGPELNFIDAQEDYVTFNFTGGVSPYEFYVDNTKAGSTDVAGENSIPNEFTEGDHTLYITDKYGCDTAGNFYVKDPIKIIQILTPDGNGINDTWTVEDLKKYPKSMVRIYDRYGRLMHKSPGVDLNWDGRFNGNLVPANDYWYHIDLFADGKIVYTGHFALIR